MAARYAPAPLRVKTAARPIVRGPRASSSSLRARATAWCFQRPHPIEWTPNAGLDICARRSAGATMPLGE
jgi:hypothetical protein